MYLFSFAAKYLNNIKNKYIILYVLYILLSLQSNS